MKIWAYVILAGLLIGAATATYRAIDRAAYTRAVAEMQAAAIKEANEAAQKRFEEWKETELIAEMQIVVEEKIVEKIRVVEKDVPRVVEKIVELKPDCGDLGPDYAGVLNAAVRASNQGSDQSAATPADVDDAL